MTSSKKKLTDEQTDNYIATIRTSDLSKSVNFHKLFDDGMSLAKVSDADVAKKFAISESTVNRWRTGTHTPPEAARNTLLAWVIECVTIRSKYAN